MCDECNKEWSCFLCLDNQPAPLPHHICSAIHKSVETRSISVSLYPADAGTEYITGGVTAAPLHTRRWLSKVSVDGGRVLTRLSAAAADWNQELVPCTHQPPRQPV